MGRGMKLLKELDSTGVNGQKESVTKKKETVDDLHQKWLKMGLLCCDTNDELIESIVEYYTSSESSDIAYGDTISDELLTFDTRFGVHSFTNDFKRELLVIDEMFSVKELNDIIKVVHSECSELDTLLMLEHLSDYVAEASDDECEDEDVTLEERALALMRQKYADLSI